MKKLNNFLNILIGATVGVLIGRGIYAYWNFKIYPDLYVMQSAPWYTSVLVYGAVSLVVVMASIVTKVIIKKCASKH